LFEHKPNAKDRKVAEEEARESGAWRKFNSNIGAWFGAVISGGILYMLLSRIV